MSRAFMKIEQAIKTKAHDDLQKIAFEFMHRVMARTPVDTGLARRSWQKIDVSKEQINIVNPVYYTVYLEHGHSRQAPRGMVRLTMTEMLNELKK
jgi:hypothetical protein